MQTAEKRNEDRVFYDAEDFVYVEFKSKKVPNKDKVYDLNVRDCSRYGLGMVITQKDFELLQTIEPGDELSNLSFFSTWSVFKIDGVVKHKTRIEEGIYRNNYLMGFQSQEEIKACTSQEL